MSCLDAQNRKNVSRMTQLTGSKWEDQPLFTEQKAHTIISYIDQQRELQSIIALDDSTDSDNKSCMSVAADITKEMEEIVDNGNSTDETDEIAVTEVMLNSIVDRSQCTTPLDMNLFLYYKTISFPLTLKKMSSFVFLQTTLFPCLGNTDTANAIVPLQ